MTPLQARETGGVRLRVSLHVVLQALDPRGLAEVTFLLLLRYQAVLLEDVVDAEVVMCPSGVGDWSMTIAMTLMALH